MKENANSLKYYFIVIGIFGLLGIKNIGIINEALIASILQLIYIIFGFIFVYIGIKINELLKKSPIIIINTLYINLAFAIINGLFNIVMGTLMGAHLIGLLLNPIITIYLIKNIKRISKENVNI